MEIKFKNIYEKTPFKNLMDTVIIKNQDYFSFANELIFSSNTEFVVGMLEGFIVSEKLMTNSISELLTLKKISVNLYTNILTYLFTDFKLIKSHYKRYPDEYIFSIEFNLSPVSYAHLKLAHNKIKTKSWTWKLWSGGSVYIDRWNNYPLNNVDNDDEILHKQLIDLKENDKIKFIRVDELIIRHITVSEPEKLYDITMAQGDATNYLLMGGPFAKNSDGDLLALYGIMSNEGIKGAKDMSMLNANRLKNYLDPDKINSYIQRDAALGLYNGTK
jgi:hypothetical protein